MIKLKIVLSIILFLSTIWAILFFCGGYLIERGVHAKFGDKIKLNNVRVSPDLKVKIGRIDLRIFSESVEMPVDGVLRAVKLDWSIFSRKPAVRLSFGPLQLNTRGSFRSGSLELMADALQNFSEGQLRLKIEYPEIVELGQFESINLAANYKGNPLWLSNVLIDFEAGQIENNFNANSFKVDGLSAEIDNVNLLQSPANQKFNLTFAAGTISDPNSFPKFLGNMLSGKLEWIKNGANVETALETAVVGFDSFDLSIEGINSKSVMGGDLSYVDTKIKMEEVLVEGQDFLLTSVTALVEAKPTEFITKVNGNLENWQVVFGENFLGTLGKGYFHSTVNIKEGNDMLINSVFDARLDAFPEIDLKVQGSAVLSGDKKLLACLPSESCVLDTLSTHYQLAIGDQSIIGTIECPSTPCALSSARHEIRTTDTTKVFASLFEAKILSPIVLTFLYSLFLSGDKSGLGHEVEF